MGVDDLVFSAFPVLALGAIFDLITEGVRLGGLLASVFS